MKIEWYESKNGFGSVDYWDIIEPIGMFIDIHPIVTSKGVMYKVYGPQISRAAEYSTLKRAKEVAEDLCRFALKNPMRTVDADLRNYPNSGVQIFNENGPVYDVQVSVCAKFHPPAV